MSAGAQDRDTGTTPARSRWRALIAILSGAGVLLLLGIGFAIVQATARSSDHARLTVREPVRALDLDLDAAELAVTATGRAPSRLSTRREWFLRRPALVQSVEGDTLRVRADCDWPSACEFQTRAELPEAVDIRARTGSGSVRVAGRPGAVDIRTGSGEVAVTGAIRDVDVGTGSGSVSVVGARSGVRAESASGSVTLRDLVGPLRVRTGSGNVTATGLRAAESQFESAGGRLELAYTRAPERLEVDLGTGVVDLVVPAGRYRLEIEVDAGPVDVRGLRSDPRAPRRIVVRAGEAEVTVRAA